MSLRDLQSSVTCRQRTGDSSTDSVPASASRRTGIPSGTVARWSPCPSGRSKQQGIWSGPSRSWNTCSRPSELGPLAAVGSRAPRSPRRRARRRSAAPRSRRAHTRSHRSSRRRVPTAGPRPAHDPHPRGSRGSHARPARPRPRVPAAPVPRPHEQPRRFEHAAGGRDHRDARAGYQPRRAHREPVIGGVGGPTATSSHAPIA